MIDTAKLVRDLELVREKSPLIHNLTNYVVMNNTANAMLAIGASPVMAHSTEEVADMAAIASAVVLNIGTLEPSWVKAMILAGKVGRSRGIPVVLDPVGVGATPYRTYAAWDIIRQCHPSIIRGNASEIMSLIDSSVKTKGVDSLDSSDKAVNAAKLLAQNTRSVVVISGPTDYITDGINDEYTYNGSTMMARVTGLGCTATAIVASVAAINSNMLEAATHGMAIMGITGEIAAACSKGNGSLQMNFLDELYNLNGDTIRKYLKTEE